MEGNLETKIFNDPITGLVRRIREIAIRRNGKFISLFLPAMLFTLLLGVVFENTVSVHSVLFSDNVLLCSSLYL